MNKNEAMTEIETIRARLTVLERIVQEEEKPQGLWRPNRGEEYYFVDDFMGVSSRNHNGDNLAQYRIDKGICFPAREAAEKAAPLFGRAHKIIQAALMADPEAGQADIERPYTAVFDHQSGKWGTCSSIRDSGFERCVAATHTLKQAEHMAAILNAEGIK